ncbi:MAG: hypothetical protein ACOYOS_16100 [Syntrophales bacterium]
MRKILVGMLLGVAGLAFSQSTEVPSVESLFSSGISSVEAGEIIGGPIYSFTFGSVDPLTDKRKISVVTIGNNSGRIDIMLEDKTIISEGKWQIGQVIFIRTPRGIMLNQSRKTGMGAGKIVEGPYRLSKASSAKGQPNFRTELSVDQYFSERLGYASRRVTLTGIVEDIRYIEGDSIWIRLAGAGDVIIAYYSESRWRNDQSIRSVIRTISPGKQVSLRGAFTMDYPNAIFDIIGIIQVR